MGLAAISAQPVVIVLMTFKLEPILMLTEIGGIQASIISSLSEAPLLAYFVHNTYFDPSVFRDMWFKGKGGTYDESGNLWMICNMGQEDGETQFSNYEVNVF